MKSEGALPIFCLALAAGCGLNPNGPGGQAAPLTRAPRRILSPLTANPLTPPPQRLAALPAPKGPTLTAEDIAYLRWLIQFDAALQQVLAQQAHTLPPPIDQRDHTRTRALLQGWEDSRQTAATVTGNASMAESFTPRLRQLEGQFANQPAPPACREIASGYHSVLVGLVNTAQFNARLYRQLANLLQNPRAASAMLPADMQDGGMAVDSRLRSELQNARNGTNAAFSDLSRRFPGQLPADVAIFRVK